MDDDLANKYRYLLLKEIQECSDLRDRYIEFPYWKDAMTERIKAYRYALHKFNKLNNGASECDI